MLGLGTMVCTPDDLNLSFALLDRWREAGGNLLDTAHLYGGGASERAIGLWLRERGCREEMIVLTKCAHHNADRPRVTPEDILCDFRDSAARLRIETFDLYLLHRDDPGVPVGPIMQALNSLVRDGRVGALGASNWRIDRIEQANNYAREHGLRGFEVISNQFSLAVPNGEIWPGCVDSRTGDFPRWLAESQTPLICWSSQGRGFFSGAFSPHVDLDETVTRVFYSEANWERLRRAQAVAENRGCSAIQVALAWVLHQPFPTHALVGPQNLPELESCLAAAELALTAEEAGWLDLKGTEPPGPEAGL